MRSGIGKLARERYVVHLLRSTLPHPLAGLPEIRRDVRTMTNEHFQITATIAAFLSGVTATIMQFTYQFTATPLENAVNSLLFCSLLFSLMSVINSLLFIKWYRSGRCDSFHSFQLFTTECFYRIPIEEHLRGLGPIFSSGPKAFVVIAVMQFSLAIALFAFTSRQVRIP